ncbi:hypothetical protein J6590_003615 [Homalodisca vitripennis]|nr:hypothetical protein J6590_003615 [Homalodisca vitripennis]
MKGFPLQNSEQKSEPPREEMERASERLWRSKGIIGSNPREQGRAAAPPPPPRIDAPVPATPASPPPVASCPTYIQPAAVAK